MRRFLEYLGMTIYIDRVSAHRNAPQVQFTERSENSRDYVAIHDRVAVNSHGKAAIHMTIAERAGEKAAGVALERRPAFGDTPPY